MVWSFSISFCNFASLVFLLLSHSLLTWNVSRWWYSRSWSEMGGPKMYIQTLHNIATTQWAKWIQMSYWLQVEIRRSLKHHSVALSSPKKLTVISGDLSHEYLWDNSRTNQIALNIDLCCSAPHVPYLLYLLCFDDVVSWQINHKFEVSSVWTQVCSP